MGLKIKIELNNRIVRTYFYRKTFLWFGEIDKCMEQYAKQEAIEFGIWISNHKLDFQPANNGNWIGLDMVTCTNSELYELWKQGKKKLKTMIQFSRKENKVLIKVEHGIFYNGGHFELEIHQSQDYQAQLLLEQFQKNLNRELSRLKDKYYREGWKDAKAKTKKRTDFYGCWEK